MADRRRVLLLLVSCCVYSIGEESQQFIPEDHLTPYSHTRHGSRRFSRDIAGCQHVRWENRTYEEFNDHSAQPPTKPSVHYQLHRFADAVIEDYSDIKRRYIVGSIAFLERPYYTLSVLEPNSPGGCKVQYWSATRSLVSETASHRVGGCRIAVNAGYFDVHNGRCLGNVVSDGRIVQTSNDEQNANFGIRQDGTLTVGYIPDQEILNSTNPFRQLVSGVIWLVRNGSNFVNESKELECSSHEDTGRMETFVNVISSRTAIGHDDQGRVVIAQVNGQTHHRGASLYEFADLLVRRGVVNAINLDGGGSSTFIKDQVLINYPSDHCPGMPEYRCARPVSTILCVHDVQCIEPECSQHGTCDLGKCECDSPWIGEGCAELNCSLVECFHNSTCLEGKCSCSAGWTGPFCNETCDSGHYGPNCDLTCYCYGRSVCNPVTGSCDCPNGYHGYGCWQDCAVGYFGQNCQQKCACSEYGECSAVNGSCLCHQGWKGITCNESIDNTPASSGVEPSNQASNSTLPVESNISTISVSPSPSTNHPASTTNNGRDIDGYRTSTETAATTCEARNQFHVTVAVAIVIITGLLSVFVHVLVCCIYHKRLQSYSLKRTTQQKIKRRKLRKKPLSMRLPLPSSSDCSI